MSFGRELESMNDHVAGNMFGPVKEQGILTAIVVPDENDIASRKLRPGIKQYPGGSDAFNLSVQERELVFAPVKRPSCGVDAISGGFSSLSGLSLEDTTVEQLENGYFLVGVSRSDYVVKPTMMKGASDPRHGFAVIVFGATSLRIKCYEDIFSGDVLVWRFPTLEEAMREASMRATQQTSPSKIKPIVTPLKWESTRYFLHNIVRILMRRDNDIGRFGIPLNNMTGYNRRPNQPHSSVNPEIRAARAIKRHTMAVAAKTVQVLATRGLITINTPRKIQQQNAKDKLLKFFLDVFSKSADGLTMDENGKIVLSAEARGRQPDDPNQIAFIAAIDVYNEAQGLPEPSHTRSKTDVSNDIPAVLKRKNYTDHAAGLVFCKTRSANGEQVTPRDVESELTKRLNETLWINGHLGLTDNGNREEKDVTFDILRASYASTAGSEALDEYNPKKYISESKSNINIKVLNAVKESETNTSGAFQELIAVVNESYETIRKRTVGTALTSCKAGPLEGRIDVVIDPRR